MGQLRPQGAVERATGAGEKGSSALKERASWAGRSACPPAGRGAWTAVSEWLVFHTDGVLDALDDER